ncbi:MAG: outer membrane beta-barrel protein, partial [Bacteroidota bacterium]
LSVNLSCPLNISSGWTTNNNLSVHRLTNSSLLSEGEQLSLKATAFNFNHQSTITLPWQLKGEISGYFNGPGLRGGDVFRAKANWSLDLGLQRKFLREQLMVRISVSDVFHQAGWAGQAEIGGLTSEIVGVWDSRRLNLNLSYSFGNKKVESRNRSTAAAREANRAG